MNARLYVNLWLIPMLFLRNRRRFKIKSTMWCVDWFEFGLCGWRFFAQHIDVAIWKSQCHYWPKIISLFGRKIMTGQMASVSAPWVLRIRSKQNHIDAWMHFDRHFMVNALKLLRMIMRSRWNSNTIPMKRNENPHNLCWVGVLSERSCTFQQAWLLT